MTILNTYGIIDIVFSIPPQEYGQTFLVHTIRIIDCHEIVLHKTQVTSI